MKKNELVARKQDFLLTKVQISICKKKKVIPFKIVLKQSLFLAFQNI